MRFYFSKIGLLLRFIFSPQLIHQKEKIVGKEGVALQMKKKGIPLIISFAGLGQQFNFVNTLASLETNVIYLRDVNHLWYLHGMEGVGSSVEEVLAFLQAKIAEFQPTRVITLGTSSGGFASILYGYLLQADSVLAFSPQTFMNRWNCIRYLDYRWLDRVVQIYQGDRSCRPYLDLKVCTSLGKINTTLIYDETHRLDRVHASRLKGENIKHLGRRGGGHNVVQILRDSGELTRLLQEAIQPKPDFI